MKRKFLNVITISGLCVFALLGAATGDSKDKDSSSSSSSSSAASSTPDLKLSSKTLFNEYHENEVAADKKYKGKRIQVSGKVESITKDILDNNIVSLTGDGYFSTVMCTLESEDVAASLKKGSSYSLNCTCEGMIVGSVQMKNCSLAQ